eukprot:Gb_12703 [translate_table: standard]
MIKSLPIVCSTHLHMDSYRFCLKQTNCIRCKNTWYSTLQQLEREFDSLKLEYERMVGEPTETETQFKPSSWRKSTGKLREIKRGIKKLEKLITSISNLLSAVQTMVNEAPEVQVVLLALGSSSMRPQHVYEIYFTCNESVPEDAGNCPYVGKKVKADVVSKKIIRALVSNGAGSAGSYSGPTKLFLLIQAPASICLPQDFLPKRGYGYSHKVEPLKVYVKSGNGNGEEERSNKFYQTGMPMDVDPQNVNPRLGDIIWFQCKYTVKGLTCQDEQC